MRIELEAGVACAKMGRRCFGWFLGAVSPAYHRLYIRHAFPQGLNELPFERPGAQQIKLLHDILRGQAVTDLSASHVQVSCLMNSFPFRIDFSQVTSGRDVHRAELASALLLPKAANRL